MGGAVRRRTAANRRGPFCAGIGALATGSLRRSGGRLAFLALSALVGVAGAAQAEGGEPVGILEVTYQPAARAQIAIWLERQDGTFVTTLRLTEATAYRGIGNRPGASQMNSGYRWPYGRREGVLPVWAKRRALAPGAEPFPRVVFQARKEGLASRTTADQSVDDYFCLSFARANSGREALDAVSCASAFFSDKGRYLTDTDMGNGYGEPYETARGASAQMAPLPMTSLYPPRMDVSRCEPGPGCHDHDDVDRFAADARRVMPAIDAITMATPQGGTPQSELVSIPAHWPAGEYVLWLEINVEGDYHDGFDAAEYPTPRGPSGQWDSWATSFGYPYRGQPSVVFAVPIELGEQGVAEYAVDGPEGKSSWDVWTPGYGELDSADGLASELGSGVDRLLRGQDGQRLTVAVDVFAEVGTGAPPPAQGPGDDAASDGEDTGPRTDDQAAGEGSGDGPAVVSSIEREGQAADTDTDAQAGLDGDNPGAVGRVPRFTLRNDDSIAHGHEWVHMAFDVPVSELPIHRYEVRVATAAIVDEDSFLTAGRPAKQAATDAEGATRLMLPTDVAAGERIEATIGDLAADTDYQVAIRAVDRRNRPGPISVAEVRTPERRFTTVTPCFVASVAYGSPLAREVGSLRRFRDRLLLSNALGRAVVRAYYRHGPTAADWLATRPDWQAFTRAGLDRLVAWLSP